MKKAINGFNSRQKGFTLIELLVCIAIVCVLAAVVVPNIGKLFNKGKQESYDTELHNVQTAVMTMMADYEINSLDAAYADINDMDLVTANGGAILLSTYMIGINEDGTVKTGCTYSISQDGGVILQSVP